MLEARGGKQVGAEQHRTVKAQYSRMEDVPNLRFCTVCASNNNRSMEAHKVLKQAGYMVRSYGTGSAVRLPGPSINKPNVFQFGTPYTEIMRVLESQGIKVHKNNGVFDMTLRNMNIKKSPERWPYFNQPMQKLPEAEHPGFKGELDFEIVITCEERCFDSVIEDFLARNYFNPNELDRKVHVFNVEIRDDKENAHIGGQAILELANSLNELFLKSKGEDGDNASGEPAHAEYWEDSIPDLIAQWQQKHENFPLLYSLCYH